MAKIFPPTFNPRRPSGVIRYALVALIVLTLLYVFNPVSSDAVPSTTLPSTEKQQPFFGNPDSVQPLPGLAKGSAGGSLDLETPDQSKSTTGGLSNADTDDKSFSGKPDHVDSSHSDTVGHSDSDTVGHSDSDTVGHSDSKTSGHSSYGSTKDSHSAPPSHPDTEANGPANPGPEDSHPIDKLIYDAQFAFAELSSKETKSVSEAAQAYRKRRGRHPPPGFDQWFEFATNSTSIIIEDFFDQIYHDLGPFWGMEPALLRKEAHDYEMKIHVRDGNATTSSDWFWTTIWQELLQSIAHLLPDVDVALNSMDEPRLVVPWEDIDGYMKKAAKTFKLSDVETVVSEFQRLPQPGHVEPDVKVQQKTWEGSKPYWPIARRGCPPDSPARLTELQASFANPPEININMTEAHSYQGYVSNFTLSNELCHQPDLQGLEGILIEPLTVSATKTLFPMFGGSKLTINNEILLPAPMYWNEEERFTGGDDHGVSWRDKDNSVIWRGVATGGLNRESNWRGFQRHRFIAMNNGTKLDGVIAGYERAENFVLPDKQYGLAAQKDGKLGSWVSEWSDVAFIDLMCDKPVDETVDDKTVDDETVDPCAHTSPHFATKDGLKMSEQFNSKYIPDIDGNSFSGRYLGFLRSTSLPIKATLWREWHDSRLVPWKHFVPMDSRFGDFYGIMEYFLGYEGRNGHDQAAEKIANEGKEWAEQVLRKEDMQIYVLRLLMEYARVVDDRREHMGWVEDAIADPTLKKIWASWW